MPAEIARAMGNGVSALEAVPAAFCAFFSHPHSFADTLRLAVSLGGDTDTIASMAGALAGAYLGRAAIPSTWATRTETAELMATLADRLIG